MARRSWPAISLARGGGRSMRSCSVASSRSPTRSESARSGSTLLLSAFIVPESLYPWLTLVSGLLVVAVGASVFLSRWRGRGRSHDHAHGDDEYHHQQHGHDHAHGHHHHHAVE